MPPLHRRPPSVLPAVLAGLLAVLAAACGGGGDAPPDAEPAARLKVLEGFSMPESAVYDRDLDRYFVSNINGEGDQADGNGFISLVHPDTGIAALKYIEGGRDGVTLNAPKGMRIVADTLWVADITVARAFHKRTGALIATMDLAPLGARFLNDVGIGPARRIYLTDTGLGRDSTGAMVQQGPSRVYVIDRDRTARVGLESATMARLNGIAWDALGQRFILVALGDPAIYAWSLGDAEATVIGEGPGGHDGVAVLSDDRFLVSSLSDSSVSLFQEGGQGTRVITGVALPADIGWDSKRKRVLIPTLSGNTLEIWRLE